MGRAPLVAQAVKKLPAVLRRGFSPWVRKIPWRRERQHNASTLACSVLWTGEPGGLQSVGRHEWGRLKADPFLGGRRPLLVAWQGRPELTGAPLFSAGPNLKEWLREQFCDHPLEHCEDTRLHDAAYVGDLQTLRSLLQEESYRR